MDEVKLRRLEISITEPCGDIISGYKAKNQILDREMLVAIVVHTIMRVCASDTSGTGDGGNIDGANNNSDSKNANAKAGFSTYNVTDANTDVDTGDTIGMGDANGTSVTNNNTNRKMLTQRLVSIFIMLQVQMQMQV